MKTLKLTILTLSLFIFTGCYKQPVEAEATEKKAAEKKAEATEKKAEATEKKAEATEKKVAEDTAKEADKAVEEGEQKPEAEAEGEKKKEGASLLPKSWPVKKVEMPKVKSLAEEVCGSSADSALIKTASKEE